MVLKRVLLLLVLLSSVWALKAQEHYIDLVKRDQEPVQTYRHRITFRAMPVLVIGNSRIAGYEPDGMNPFSYFTGLELGYEYRVNKRLGISIPLGVMLDHDVSGQKTMVYNAYGGIGLQPYYFNSDMVSLYMQFESGVGLGVLRGSRVGYYMNMTLFAVNIHPPHSDRWMFVLKWFDLGMYFPLDKAYRGLVAINARFISFGFSVGLGKSSIWTDG